MQRRAPFVVLLASALTFLVSLYLPWQAETSQSLEYFSGGGTQAGLLNLFGGAPLDAWSTTASAAAAALAALLLGTAAVAVLVRRDLATRLPLGRAAVLAAYLALAVWVETRLHERLFAPGATSVGFHTAYGAYVAALAVAAALLAAGSVRRRELGEHRYAVPIAIPATVFLAAALLPWYRFRAAPHPESIALDSSAGTIAAVLAIWLLGSRDRSTAAHSTRSFQAAAVALFAGVAFTVDPLGLPRAYGAWAGVGAATALVVVAVVLQPHERPRMPPWPAFAVSGAAAALAASMFLPWVSVCYPDSSDFGTYAGRCVSATEAGSVSVPTGTLLALALAAVALARRRLPLPSIVPATGAALLVATTAIAIARNRAIRGIGFGLPYGAIIGLVAAAALLVLTAIRPRGVLPRLRASVDWRSAALRLPPLLASAAFVALILVPEWNVLPYEVGRKLLLVELSWLTIAAMLLALWLVALWLQQIVRPAANDAPLVLLPVAMLALAAPDLILLRHRQPTWGSGIAVVLCIALALFGHVERSEGLENLQVPEILRIDRI